VQTRYRHEDELVVKYINTDESQVWGEKIKCKLISGKE